MPILFAALLSIALVLQSVTAQAARPCRDCVRIGSWNIQDFGSERRRQTAAPSELAELIAHDWQIDLLAMQEINTASREWRELSAALQRQGYQVAVGASGRQQGLALVWRAPVRLKSRVSELKVADRYQPSANCRSSGLRKPLYGYFSAGKFDFYAVNVHLKSSYGNARCGHEVRALQSKELARLSGQLAQNDPDVLLIGDFNASAKHESLTPLATRKNIIDKSVLAPHSGKSSQGKPVHGNIIDLILIDSNATAEWIQRSSVAYDSKDANAFYRRYSDHRPVWADFDTRRDDD